MAVDVLTGFEVPTLVAVFLQSILYGIYLVTCGNCASALTRVNGRWRNRREIQWPFLLAGTFLLINSTVIVCIGFYRCLELLAFNPEGLADRAQSTYWLNIFKPVLTLLQSFVGDSILIYRTYIVYRKNWRIVAPSIALWLADTVCGCRGLQLEGSGASEDQYAPWFTAFWALSVTQHILTTLLLLYRLWRVDRSLPGIVPFPLEQETPVQRIMRSIAESGMLYTVAAFIVLICEVTQSAHVLRVATAVELITVGLAFNLILVRAKQWVDDSHHEQQSSDPQFTSIGPTVSSSAFSVSATTVGAKA